MSHHYTYRITWSAEDEEHVKCPAREGRLVRGLNVSKATEKRQHHITQ